MLFCADSRVCPESIFDQRSDSIFETRNAGNVVDDDVLGSFEFAVEHLHVPLIVVLGHKGCGAIHAVCEAQDRPLPNHLRELQKHMEGIHKDVMNAHDRHDAHVLDELSAKNAAQQARLLVEQSSVLAAAVKKGDVRLHYAICDMESGVVEFFDVAKDAPRK